MEGDIDTVFSGKPAEGSGAGSGAGKSPIEPKGKSPMPKIGGGSGGFAPKPPIPVAPGATGGSAAKTSPSVSGSASH
jgi:hypothetical protein